MRTACRACVSNSTSTRIPGRVLCVSASTSGHVARAQASRRDCVCQQTSTRANMCLCLCVRAREDGGRAFHEEDCHGVDNQAHVGPPTLVHPQQSVPRQQLQRTKGYIHCMHNEESASKKEERGNSEDGKKKDNGWARWGRDLGNTSAIRNIHSNITLCMLFNSNYPLAHTQSGGNVRSREC